MKRTPCKDRRKSAHARTRYVLAPALYFVTARQGQIPVRVLRSACALTRPVAHRRGVAEMGVHHGVQRVHARTVSSAGEADAPVASSAAKLSYTLA
jgi:hypothetical protein